MNDTSTFSNDSTATASSAASSFVIALFNWLSIVYFPLIAYYTPLVIAVGVLSNAFTLVVMLSSRAVASQTSRTARMYYIALACADEVVLLAHPFVRFLGDGLFVITNGQAFFYLDQVSDVTCKSLRYMFMSAEGYSNWTLIALNVERIFVLKFPFVARRVVTPSRVRIALLCLLLVVLVISIGNIDVHKINTASATNKVSVQCQAIILNFTVLSVIEAFTMGFVLEGVPVFLLVILVTVLVYSVRRAQRGLQQHDNVSAIQRSNEKQESKRSSAEALGAIITISAVTFLFYFSWALVWSVFTALQPLFSGDLARLLNLMRRFLVMLGFIANSANFYIYLIHIKVFRREFVRIFSCDLLNISAGVNSKVLSSQSNHT